MSPKTPPTRSNRPVSSAGQMAALPPFPEDLTRAIPAWPVVDQARRRVDTARSITGRVVTLAGAAAAAVGLFTPVWTGVSLAADAALTLTGVGTLRLWKPEGQQKATATALYLMPGTGLAGLLILERLVPGIHWGEALALAAWTTATWVLRPARLARHMVAPLPAPPEPVEVAVEEPGPELDPHPVARWWADRVAIEGGAAPGTLLRGIEEIGESALRAVICSARDGEPVPNVSTTRLSALMDVPEDQITITALPGRGTSVKRLTIGTPDQVQPTDPAEMWAQRIAPVAMPGTVLMSVRVGRPALDDDAAEEESE
ncbi:hypothetical protein GT755_38120 [Herbidospora sp. NEAU-GS84]|uniref:Uncharacterized protein n=1 Tax=Herbidospora solisilvae TaxID=2696284 RepID=A0A7C9N2K7_9ACTN|nr:hypothetical protein [Herbidospora solisilvae]NAS27471.1 hypothetical protein [Herbidospora solisilvae]